MPELGLELVRDVDRERFRSRLPRWDPRLWGDAQFSKNTRPGNRLLKLGLAWGRERVKARKLQQENVTPPGDVAPVSRFTGKEEDVEVGLQYFGKRYLSPYLGRWISADPLTIHGIGADPNLYAYVTGQVLKSVDPLGLCGPECGTEGGPGVYQADPYKGQTEGRKPNEGFIEKLERARAWVNDKASRVFFKAMGTSLEKHKETKARGQQPGMGPVKTDPVGQVGSEWVKDSLAASANVFTIYGGAIAFGKGAIASGSGLAPVSPFLEKLLGSTYTRLIAETGSEGAAMAAIQRQATVAMRFVDGGGKTRTVIATANREVWKDLSKARAAGDLGEAELLPFVNRPNKNAPHPDMVAADFAKSQGASEATFASVPKTCEGCQAGIPEKVPAAQIETPKKQ